MPLDWLTCKSFSSASKNFSSSVFQNLVLVFLLPPGYSIFKLLGTSIARSFPYSMDGTKLLAKSRTRCYFSLPKSGVLLARFGGTAATLRVRASRSVGSRVLELRGAPGDGDQNIHVAEHAGTPWLLALWLLTLLAVKLHVAAQYTIHTQFILRSNVTAVLHHL